jgi:hypothetical protein
VEVLPDREAETNELPTLEPAPEGIEPASTPAAMGTSTTFASDGANNVSRWRSNVTDEPREPEPGVEPHPAFRPCRLARRRQLGNLERRMATFQVALNTIYPKLAPTGKPIPIGDGVH